MKKFFQLIFGGSWPERTDSAEEQAVIVRFPLSDDKFGANDERQGIYNLEKRLEDAIESAGVGEFDGDEFGEGAGTLFMYGPDAEKLFTIVAPLLRGDPLTGKGYARIRKGAPGAEERKEHLAHRT